MTWLFRNLPRPSIFPKRICHWNLKRMPLRCLVSGADQTRRVAARSSSWDSSSAMRVLARGHMLVSALENGWLCGLVAGTLPSRANYKMWQWIILGVVSGRYASNFSAPCFGTARVLVLCCIEGRCSFGSILSRLMHKIKLHGLVSWFLTPSSCLLKSVACPRIVASPFVPLAGNTGVIPQPGHGRGPMVCRAKD